MAASQEQWCGREVGLKTVTGDGKQGIHVLLAGCGDADYFTIHSLFASQLDLSQQPPEAGMEPENGANNFFEQSERPVAAADVRHLMAGNRPLSRRRHVKEFEWQQDHGISDSECHRTRDIG